jgi:hypothetical protein
MRRDVAKRAANRCEYCLIHQEHVASRHQVDHVISEKHGGDTVFLNLALSCLPCNRRKSSDIGSNDPTTGQFTRLFNPREQRWLDHFRLDGPRLIGITPEGRTTVTFLQLNAPQRLLERAALIAIGQYSAG